MHAKSSTDRQFNQTNKKSDRQAGNTGKRVIQRQARTKTKRHKTTKSSEMQCKQLTRLCRKWMWKPGYYIGWDWQGNETQVDANKSGQCVMGNVVYEFFWWLSRALQLVTDTHYMAMLNFQQPLFRLQFHMILQKSFHLHLYTRLRKDECQLFFFLSVGYTGQAFILWQ